MSNDLKTKANGAMLVMKGRKGDVGNANVSDAMAVRTQIEEIHGLTAGLLLLWDTINEEMEKDGMDIVNEFREAGAL